MEFVEGFVEGVPPDVAVYQSHIVYRLIHEDKVQYTLFRPGVHIAGTNNKWKQTHYMVIEEPSAKPAPVAHGLLTTENPFIGLPGNSQSEDFRIDTPSLDRRVAVLEERVGTLAKSTEHLMDIVSALIKKVVELEGKR